MPWEPGLRLRIGRAWYWVTACKLATWPVGPACQLPRELRAGRSRGRSPRPPLCPLPRDPPEGGHPPAVGRVSSPSPSQPAWSVTRHLCCFTWHFPDYLQGQTDSHYVWPFAFLSQVDILWGFSCFSVSHFKKCFHSILFFFFLMAKDDSLYACNLEIVENTRQTDPCQPSPRDKAGTWDPLLAAGQAFS